jgi:hypothetical protein
MALALGGFTNAFVGADEKRKDRRAQNAQLYAEWIRANPDASVAERKEYYGNLAGNSRGLQSGIPTEETMKRQVKKYKDAKAKQDAAAAQAAKRQKAQDARQSLTDIISLGDAMAGMYGTEDEEIAAFKAQMNSYGLVDEKMFGAVYKRAGEKAWGDWQENNARVIDDYLNNPSKGAFDSLNTKAGIWGDKFTNQFKGAYVRQDKKNEGIVLAEVTKVLTAVNQTQEGADVGIEAIKNQYPDAYEALRLKGAFGTSETVLSTTISDAAEAATNKASNYAFEAAQNIKSEEEWKVLRADLLLKYPDQAQGDSVAWLDSAYQRMLANKEGNYERIADGYRSKLDSASKTMSPEKYGVYLKSLMEQAKLDGVRGMIQVASFNEINEGIEQDRLDKLKTEDDARFTQLANEIAASATTQPEYDRAISALKDSFKNNPNSDTLQFDTATADANIATRLSELKTKQEEEVARNVAVAVEEGELMPSAQAGMSKEDAVAAFEAKMEATLKTDVTLTPEQKARITDRYAVTMGELMATITQAANKSENANFDFAGAADAGREEFLKKFERDLTALGITISPAKKAEYTTLANGGFDAAFEKARRAINARENETIAEVIATVEAGNRSLIGMGYNADVFEPILRIPSIIGELDKDDVAVVGAQVTSDVRNEIQSVFNTLGLPATNELIMDVMNELLLGQKETEEGLEVIPLYNKDSGTNLEVVREAVYASLMDMEGGLLMGAYGGIEQSAFLAAMRETGIVTFKDMNLKDRAEDLAAFKAQYKLNRKAYVNSQYNVVDPAYTDAAERSSALVNRVSTVLEDGRVASADFSRHPSLSALEPIFTGTAEKIEAAIRQLDAAKNLPNVDVPNFTKLAIYQELLQEINGSGEARQLTRALHGEMLELQREIGNLRQAGADDMYGKGASAEQMRSTINGNVQALQGQLAYLEEIRAGIEGYVNDAEMEVASLTELEDKRIAEDEEVEAERIAGVESTWTRYTEFSEGWGAGMKPYPKTMFEKATGLTANDNVQAYRDWLEGDLQKRKFVHEVKTNTPNQDGGVRLPPEPVFQTPTSTAAAVAETLSLPPSGEVRTVGPDPVAAIKRLFTNEPSGDVEQPDADDQLQMRTWIRDNAATVAAELGYTGDSARRQLINALQTNDPALLELWEQEKSSQ